MTTLWIISYILIAVSLTFDVIAIRWHHQDRLNRKTGRHAKHTAKAIIAYLKEHEHEMPCGQKEE